MPWLDFEGPVDPIGGWLAHRACHAKRENGQCPFSAHAFEVYVHEHAPLRAALLETCRAGLSEGYVNSMHSHGCEREWRGLPDWRACPLPPTCADIDLVALRELLEAGVFPDCSDAYGRTPVFYACLH